MTLVLSRPLTQQSGRCARRQNEGVSMKLAVFISSCSRRGPAPKRQIPAFVPATPPMSNPSAGARWNGWGADLSNTRSQTAQQAGLTDAQVPALKLKWAFGIPDATQSRAQPAIAGGRMFFGSAPGIVYSLDAKTGCTYWTFKAQAGVRTAISVGPYKGAGGTAGNAVYFADASANAYAVDAMTGKQIWTRKLDDHAAARSTGAPILHDGRLYRSRRGRVRRKRGSIASIRVLHVPRQPFGIGCEYR